MSAFTLHTAWLATSLLSASFVALAGEIEVARPNQSIDGTRNSAAIGAQHGHLGPDDRISDLLSHPAFSGYPHLLMPWSDRAYDQTMRLGDFGRLLP